MCIGGDRIGSIYYPGQGRRKLFHSGGAALKGEHLCILIAKWGTWVNIQKISTVTPGLSGLELSRNLIYPTINSATLTISMYTNLPHLSGNLCYPTSILATNCVG